MVNQGGVEMRIAIIEDDEITRFNTPLIYHYNNFTVGELDFSSSPTVKLL